MGHYIDAAAVKARVSEQVFRACYDDGNDGEPDAAPVALLIADAESYVEGFLRGIYVLEEVRAAPPHEVVRYCLDVAHAYMRERFPTIVKVDSKAIFERVKRELMQLRTEPRRLDVTGSPEPGANQGGMVAQALVGFDGQRYCVERLFDFGTTDVF